MIRLGLGGLALLAAAIATPVLADNTPPTTPVVTAPGFDPATLRARLSPQMAPPGRQMPSDAAHLDALLKAQDFGPLADRLKQAHTSSDIELDMTWERAKIIEGAGFIVSYAYMSDLWRLGSALPPPSSDVLKRSAGTAFLYSVALISTDGPKCADPSAPGHRLDQLIAQNRPLIKYMLDQPVADRMAVGSLALAIEAATADLRADDTVLCSGGADEMSQNLAAQGAKPLQQVPNAPGTFGKSYEVPVAPGYKPGFVSETQWAPKQTLARQKMPAAFTRLLSQTAPANPSAAPK